MTRGTLVAAIAAAALVVAGIALIVVAEYADDSTSAGPAAPVGPPAVAVGKSKPATKPFPALSETRIRIGDDTLDTVIADESAERYRGLRRRSSLGDYDGMLFVFDSDTKTGFTMSTVPVPLDIGFYDREGRFVDRLRMEPCPGTDLTCPRYVASGVFRYAVETLAGDLPPGNLGSP